MCAFAFGQHGPARLVQHLICELDERSAQELDSGADQNLIVITSGRLEAAADLRHSDVAVILLLHQTVFEPKFPEEFHSSNFKPDNVVRVIDHTHLVSFCIAHADASFTDVIRIFHSFLLYFTCPSM